MRGILKLPALGILVLIAAACADDVTPFAPEASQDRITAEDAESAFSLANMTIAERVIYESENNEEFETLLDVVLAADPAVLETLSGKGQHTVFAPTDEAFDALISTGALDGLSEEELSELFTEVLLYHVTKGRMDSFDVLASDQIRMLNGEFTRINGAEETINDVMIIATDIEAKNGIIHVIDAVLLPPGSPKQGNKARMTILDLVEASASAAEGAEFTLLQAALQAASPGIAETLDGSGQFTVFAPTDAAFNALGIFSASDLPEQTALDAILLYHVTQGRLMAADVATKSTIRMLDGNRLSADGTVLDGSVNIILTDIETKNGVVHVIDGVLLPST
jgi:uncharacterized surface protein with fasciclin (FAS1) repeats